MSIHSNPSELAKALGKANKRIAAVSYEYPGFWFIETKADSYALGDVNGTIDWSNQVGTEADGLANSSEFTAPGVIAKAFSAWLDKVEAN